MALVVVGAYKLRLRREILRGNSIEPITPRIQASWVAAMLTSRRSAAVPGSWRGSSSFLVMGSSGSTGPARAV